MIGADPCTGWLGDVVELDDRGFILTGTDLPLRHPVRTPPIRIRHQRTGHYAVGDVRSGSVKRVASAVGEGSVVVQADSRLLASTPITAARH